MSARFPDLEPADGKIAELAFEFVQFLLDDDANLTPAGNLTGGARQKCRARFEEILTADESGRTDVPVAEPAVAEPAGAL